MESCKRPELHRYRQQFCRFWRVIKILWGIGLFTAVINLLMLAPAIYMLQVYDRVLASANTMTLLMLTVLVLGVFVLLVY